MIAKKFLRGGLAGLALLGLAATPAMAQEGDDGEAGDEPLLTGVAKELWDGKSFEVESYLSWFPQTHPTNGTHHVDDTAVDWWNRASMNTSAMLTDTLFFNVDAFAAFSTIEGERRGFVNGPGNRDLQPPRAGFDTLFVRHEAMDYELLVGKDYITIGVAEMYSPTNLFGQATAANPQHPQKQGRWQLRLDYFVDADTLSFHVIPFEKRPYTPQGASRWLGSAGSGAFYSLNIPVGYTVEDHYHQRSPENFGYLARYKGFREGFDFFGLAYHGPSPYPVLKLDTTTLKAQSIYPLATIAGGGISKVQGAWKFYGEGVVQVTDLQRDQNFLKYVAGFSYRETDWANKIGLEEIQPILEYGGELVFGNQAAEDFAVNSQNARFNKDSLLARLVVKQDEEFSYSFGYTRNFTDKDYSYALGMEYKPDYNTTYRIQGAMFGGDTDTQLGRWRRNDYIEIGVTHKF